MPITDRSPSPATASSTFVRPRASLEPEAPVTRALNRIKGEGRRRIVLGLVAMNVRLSRIPAALLRENLTAADYSALSRKNSWPLAGELLPDLLPGEVEEARLLWLLPNDDRVIALRARPHGAGAIWRAVDDAGGIYVLPGSCTPWPATDRDVVNLIDRLESDSFPHPLGALAACWQAARRLGLERQRVREHVIVRAINRGLSLREIVDERFDAFWDGQASGEAAEEGIQ